MADWLKTPKTPRSPGDYGSPDTYNSPSISHQPYDRKTFKSYERVHGLDFKDPKALDTQECSVELALKMLGNDKYFDYYRPTEGMEEISTPDSTEDYSPMMTEQNQYFRWDYDWRNHFGKDALEKKQNRNYHVMTAELGREKWMEKMQERFVEIGRVYDIKTRKIVLVGEGSRGNEVGDWPVMQHTIDSVVTDPQTERETLLANALKILVNEASKLAEEKAAMEHLAKIYKMRADAFKDYVWKDVCKKKSSKQEEGEEKRSQSDGVN